MSDSFNTEQQLDELAEKLETEARSLRDAAEILRTLRNGEYHKAELASAKDRAKSWMRP